MFQTGKENFDKNTGVRSVELSPIHSHSVDTRNDHSHDVDLKNEKYNYIPVGKDWINHKES